MKFFENIFNDLNFEINDCCESSLMYNYKLLFLNDNNLTKFKNLNSQLNHFVISSFPNFKINFNFFFRKVCGNKKGSYLCTPIKTEGKKEGGWKQ